MSAIHDDTLHPTDRWARRVCEADAPQDSSGRSIEEDARNRLFGADTLADAQDPEGRSLEDEAYARLFGAPPAAGPQPARIGKYTLGKTLGGGGMGEVFLGDDTELGRKAAIKLLRARSRKDPRERDRLLREAQALAKLSDANVVGVFDCGVHEDRVYLAMEYVEGTTLRDWQDEATRGWREVVARYLAAGRGLAAIHAAGLVHRDFKPQNVLVSRKGEVKITDFGLAIAPGARARPPAGPIDREALHRLLATQLTTTAAVLGTPLYISPEQLACGPVDARSDQFSFCVALFEALYGGHPYAAPDPSASRATTSGKAARGAVGTEPSSPPSMMSLVTGLIDGPLRRPPKIVIPGRVFRAIERGLAREPGDRYPSMEALLADLARDPLRKYGPSTAVAGFGFVAGLALYVVNPPPPPPVCEGIDAEFDGAWTGDRAAAVERAILGSGSPHAKTAAERVRRTLDAYRDEWIAARTDNCVATAVRGAQPLDLRQRRDTCLNDARGTVAAVVDQLARADAAAVEAIADALALLPPLELCSAEFQGRQTCLDVADDPALRERLDRARALEVAGKFAEAEAAAAAAAVVAAAADRPRLAAEAELLRGRVLAEQSRSADADAAFAAAHRLSEGAGCEALAFEAATRRTKLVALHSDLPAAQGLAWSELARAKLQRLPASDRLAAAYHSDLGLLYQHREDLPGAPAERLARARKEHQRAFELRQKLAGDEQTLDLAISHLNLGVLAIEEGKPEVALAHIDESLARSTAIYGEDHPRLWSMHYGRGQALLHLERLAEARKELDKAIALASSGLGEQHGAVGILTYVLAISYDGVDPDRALALAKSALAMYEREIPDRDPQRVDPLVMLGQLHSDRNEHAEALPYREQALRRLRSAGPAVRAGAHLALARTLHGLGRRDEALDHARLAAALLDELDAPPPELIEDLASFKSALLQSTRPTRQP